MRIPPLTIDQKGRQLQVYAEETVFEVFPYGACGSLAPQLSSPFASPDVPHTWFPV